MTRDEITLMFPRASKSVLAANAGFAFQPEIVPPAAVAKVEATRKQPKMNGTERDYGLILEAMLRRGDIVEYAFEPFSLRYGAHAYYKPDWVARTGGEVTIADLTKLCSLHIIDIFSEPELYATYQKLTAQVQFRIIEVKGAFIYPEAKPRFKAAKLRHGWAEWEMHQKKAGNWARLF